MCKLPERYRRDKYCFIPLPKQHIPEGFGIGTENERIRETFV